MRKSNELQIGKAGEYIVCADLIIKGLTAYPSEQGLPYDVVIDNGLKLLKCQVKTTEKPRVIPQRNKTSYAYIFNIKRHGRNHVKRYTYNEVDVFALVELETRTVAYIKNADMPDTLNIRVDRLRGTYHDEVGIKNYKDVIKCKENGLNQRDTIKKLNIHQTTVNKIWQDGFKPFKTNARYFSDYYKYKKWFEGLL